MWRELRQAPTIRHRDNIIWGPPQVELNRILVVSVKSSLVSYVMNKNSKALIDGTPSIINISCELVSGEDISYLEGRLKTFIDSIIPEGQIVQNRATKDIIRVILWDWFRMITNYYTDHLYEKKDWYKENKGLERPDFTNSHKEK